MELHGNFHFCNWAFNLPEEKLKLYWDNIPEGTDVLLCHSPPYGIMDTPGRAGKGSKHIGSKTLLDRVIEIKPKIMVFGHNHNSNGVIEVDGTTFINCSMVDEEYKLTKKPIYLEI